MNYWLNGIFMHFEPPENAAAGKQAFQYYRLFFFIFLEKPFYSNENIFQIGMKSWNLCSRPDPEPV